MAATVAEEVVVAVTVGVDKCDDEPTVGEIDSFTILNVGDATVGAARASIRVDPSAASALVGTNDPCLTAFASSVLVLSVAMTVSLTSWNPVAAIVVDDDASDRPNNLRNP